MLEKFKSIFLKGIEAEELETQQNEMVEHDENEEIIFDEYEEED